MHYAQVVHLTTLATMQLLASMVHGDLVTWHKMIRDILAETCRWAHIEVKVEVGNNLSIETTVRPV